MESRMKLKTPVGIALALTVTLCLSRCRSSHEHRRAADPYSTWQVYGGSPANIHYSTLHQINRSNVGELKPAWTYHTGDAFKGSKMEANPIIIGKVLYTTTPKYRVIALDAATGKLLWRFDPHGDDFTGAPELDNANRGVSYWASGTDQRIFSVGGYNLYAIDAKTGKAIRSFGENGHVDLREGLGRDPKTLAVTATSPGAIYKDLIIMGSTVPEDLPAAPGDIRAYDVRTGEMRWIFHTIPQPGEIGYNTWPKDAWKYIGGANAWGGISLDTQRGLAFAATGSPAFDFDGSDRLGDNLFSDCVIALNAQTGKLVWYFQGVRHDLWDRDFPAAPALVTVKRNGQMLDAIAQITKSGFVFVFERATGKPLFPIEYRKVPASDVDGEKAAPTQPFPLLPAPFARQVLTEDMITDRTPEAHQTALAQLKKLRYGGQFIPPSIQGTVFLPGTNGGGEWGGPAFDPETGLLYVNSGEQAKIFWIIPRKKPTKRADGRQLYLGNCSGCHKADMSGNPPDFPSLRNIGQRLAEPAIEAILVNGAGLMPSFRRLGNPAIQSLVAYLTTGKRVIVDQAGWNEAEMGPWLKYAINGYQRFLDPDGYPAIKPPWGTLNAIDLNTGVFTWKIPFGEYPALVKQGITNTGCKNFGGPLVTTGGLLFIAATNCDNKFRAYDKATGKLLWEAILPYAGNATPATYEVNGRQFIVIGAGGGHWGADSGGTYVAFSLPRIN